MVTIRNHLPSFLSTRSPDPCAGQSFCLITPQKEGHDYTAFERQQADPVDALKAHGPDVVGHRGVTAELGPLALVPPVSLANPVDAQASHLGNRLNRSRTSR